MRTIQDEFQDGRSKDPKDPSRNKNTLVKSRMILQQFAFVSTRIPYYNALTYMLYMLNYKAIVIFIQ